MMITGPDSSLLFEPRFMDPPAEPYGLDWVLPQVMAAYGEVVEL